MSRCFRTIWVVSRRNEELGDVLDGALLKGLNHVVVLGQGCRDAPGDKLGLSKPAANQSSRSLTAMALMVLMDSLATGSSQAAPDPRTLVKGSATAGEGLGVAALLPRTLSKARPALILRLCVSIAKTQLGVKVVGRSPL